MVNPSASISAESGSKSFSYIIYRYRRLMGEGTGRGGEAPRQNRWKCMLWFSGSADIMTVNAKLRQKRQRYNGKTLQERQDAARHPSIKVHAHTLTCELGKRQRSCQKDEVWEKRYDRAAIALTHRLMTHHRGRPTISTQHQHPDLLRACAR